MKIIMRFVFRTEKLFNQLNLRQSSLNAILTFAFRFASLALIPLTLRFTTSIEYATMATAAILFQLACTLFVGSIQRRIFETEFSMVIRTFKRILLMNFFFLFLLYTVTNSLFLSVKWLDLRIMNLALFEAFLYSIFNGLVISSKLKTGNFQSVRKIQILEFLMIGPLRLFIFFFTSSLLIWAIVGVLIRLGQLGFFAIRFARTNDFNFNTKGNKADFRNQKVNFDYSFINLSFWLMLNCTPLISLRIAPPNYVEVLQVSIAVAGILGTLLSQVANAMTPIFLQGTDHLSAKKIQKQFGLLATILLIFVTPPAIIMVGKILTPNNDQYLDIILIYLCANYLFGFISLYQISSYGSILKTKVLRNGCIAALVVILISDFFVYISGKYNLLSIISLFGFFILTLFLYRPSTY